MRTLAGSCSAPLINWIAIPPWKWLSIEYLFPDFKIFKIPPVVAFTAIPSIVLKLYGSLCLNSPFETNLASWSMRGLINLPEDDLDQLQEPEAIEIGDKEMANLFALGNCTLSLDHELDEQEALLLSQTSVLQYATVVTCKQRIRARA